MHAHVKIGEYDLPLIGVPHAEGQETCDRCGQSVRLHEIVFTGSAFLCDNCAGKPKALIVTQLHEAKTLVLPKSHEPKKIIVTDRYGHPV